MTRQADFKRRVRERMARTGESYTAAREQLVARSRPGRLHVTNGDSTAASLLQTPLVERIVVWRDVLHEGPVPDVGDAQLRAVRARFLAEADHRARLEPERRAFEERDAALAAAREGDYLLWFEADLYDQLQIAQVLARLAELHVPAERITLICIGEYLGIAHFGGLGELRPDQLEGLPAVAAATLSDDALALAARAWAALRAPDPRGFADIVAARSPRCASCPRPSIGSVASTPGRATACRSPSAGCSPRSPRARPRRARRSSAARRARRALTSATRGPSRPSSAWRAPRSRWSRRAPALSTTTRRWR